MSIFTRRVKSTFLQVVDLSRPDDIQSRNRVRLHWDWWLPQSQI